MKRTASAVWNGDIRDGSGTLSTQSHALEQMPFSFTSRFAEGAGTNPEELLAAAHAGCFTMILCHHLSGRGFKPESLEANATITMNSMAITSSEISVVAKVPGISNEQFESIAEVAKGDCMVSKVFNMPISLSCQLI